MRYLKNIEDFNGGDFDKIYEYLEGPLTNNNYFIDTWIGRVITSIREEININVRAHNIKKLVKNIKIKLDKIIAEKVNLMKSEQIQLTEAIKVFTEEVERLTAVPDRDDADHRLIEICQIIVEDKINSTDELRFERSTECKKLIESLYQFLINVFNPDIIDQDKFKIDLSLNESKNGTNTYKKILDFNSFENTHYKKEINNNIYGENIFEYLSPPAPPAPPPPLTINDIKSYRNKIVLNPSKKLLLKPNEILAIEREVLENKFEIEVDKMLDIVNDLIKANKLYMKFPRTGSKGYITMDRSDKYEDLGKGGSKTNPRQISYGAFRIVKVYNEFMDGINEILKDKNYQRTIFSDTSRFRTGDNKLLKGKSGKDLLLLITKMLDGKEIYAGSDGNSQGIFAKFMLSYFNIKDDSSNTGGSTRSSVNKDETKPETKPNPTKEKIHFERIGSTDLNDFKKGEFYMFKNRDGYTIYVYVVEIVVGDKVYFKFSTKFGNLNKYIDRSSYDLEKGDLDGSDFSDINTTKTIRFSKIENLASNSQYNIGDNLEINEYIKIIDYISGTPTIKTFSLNKEIGDIFKLIKESDGSKFRSNVGITGSVDTSIDSIDIRGLKSTL